MDPFCCNVAWDGECAFHCLQFGGCAKPATDGGTDAGEDVDASDANVGDTGSDSSDGSDGSDGAAGHSGDSGVGGKAGAAGSAADAGTAGNGSEAGPSAEPAESDSCGCRSAGRSREADAMSSFILALLLIGIRRRKSASFTSER